MDSPIEILKKYWGYNVFRSKQEQIINRVIENKDTVALLPTGGGKSLCYQLPAILSEGCTLVISPLIALMQDQVDQMNQKGIKSMMLTNTQPLGVQLDNCLYGNYKLIYCSPEKTLSTEFRLRIKELNINRIAVDEAHCISEWGNDFRPAFKQLKKLRELLPLIPILAVTATATPKVLQDIIESLELQETCLFQESFIRPNIKLKTLITEDKLGTLIKLLSGNNDSGIIYCGSRKKTEQVVKILRNNSISCDYFHGGKSTSERKELLHNWLTNKTKIMVATNAFGMGVDKSDVKTVIHLNLPSSIENLYQEIGRAGRDGLSANAYLLLQASDKNRTRDQFLGAIPDKEFIRVCYKNLCNYLNIAYGEGNDLINNFSLADFCKTYTINPKKTLTTLSYIEQEGIFNLIKYNKQRAVINFLINQNQILELLRIQSDASRVIQEIIRNHHDVYSSSFELDIERIVRVSSISFKTVITTLEKWHNDGNLLLDNAQTDMQIQWLAPREDQFTLSPLLQRLDRYTQVKKDKIEAVIAYAYSTNDCKQKQILNYFGEKSKEKCKQCNASECLSPKHNVESIIREIIIEKLQINKMSLKDLDQSIADYTTFEIGECVRLLLENNDVILTTDNKLKINQ
ncbi:MAG: RecQ family ATP-dependent DNA helicase [Flavobacteriaceae bacterium]|nr:RecQ family ATP-dependent DNA helicase [Flavobacteriaceae bacterium]MDO7598553.1 RecQ family ATP-dependent DNA helicase [Flavobacteriaceae bacterium]